MDRKKFGAVLDEAVGQLEGEVRVLKNQKQTLTVNVKDLENQRDKLSKEIVDLEAERAKNKAANDKKVEEMNQFIVDKISEANKKDSTASKKLSEANNKAKDAEDLIKSNEGLQKSLVERNDSSKVKQEKLVSISKLIVDSMKTI